MHQKRGSQICKANNSQAVISIKTRLMPKTVTKIDYIKIVVGLLIIPAIIMCKGLLISS